MQSPTSASGLSTPDKYEPIMASAPTPPSNDNTTEGTPNAVESQKIDRLPSGGLPNLAHTGFHMPPEVLGQAESPKNDQKSVQQSQKVGNLAEVNLRARKRSSLAIKATQSQAAAAAAAAQVVSESDKAFKFTPESSIFTLLTYRGMEVIFADTGFQKVVGICSRTHLLFQTLNLASESPVVSISSNSNCGMIIVAHKDGTIQTYQPLPTDPSNPKEPKQNNVIPSAYGRFRWIDCLTIRASEVFYQPGDKVKFQDRRGSQPGELVDISSSCDHKILVAHRKQLAVFEATPLNTPQDDSSEAKISSVDGNATLLWTTVLPANIVTAKISGDGQALVAVLDEPNEDGTYGALTFVHDMDDGSSRIGRPSLERIASVGMVYRPGPLLLHSTPVTRISFRGLGHKTSNVDDDDDGQGNDLLLTYCEEDSAARIFNQNSWQQLMLWIAPPNSRADWIRGSVAFSLGDLESQKKPRNNTGSNTSSRRPSATSSTDEGINAGLRNARSLGSGAPTTAAGAWIAEITFRNAFPALRLSRLSYMKRGNDDSQPAHFESVAAILPAGSIVSRSVLNADDMGLTIQGIWPAWNPWLSETTGADSSDTLSGSAMQFLGLSSVPPATSSYFGDSYLGGTHSPPTELRITAAHPKTGMLVLMEFPLWGDEDFGAMELGSPLRSVLSLADIQQLNEAENQKDVIFTSVSMDYESSRLCAQIEAGARSISVLWRKQGSMSLYSPDWSAGHRLTRRSILEVAAPSAPELFHDLSVVSVPLALPPLLLPSGSATGYQDTIVAVKWWPDESFGGPPLLLAITKSATLLLFEIPPPWCVREPAMPNYDPFNAASSHGSISSLYGAAVSESISDEEGTGFTRKEYDVAVTPHPDFGLGLRLESPLDDLPAIAGSFKKHPLNGGMLPAEKTGMIVLGDEVLKVNGVSLEHMTFDDIIATVRHVGAEAGPGQPLTLRFRPLSLERRNSFALQESLNARSMDASGSVEPETAQGRRSVIGVSPKNPKRKDAGIHRRNGSDDGSIASLLVGSSGEVQQEFGRLIAVVRKALPSVDGEDFSRRLVLLPWGKGSGAPAPNKLRGAALLILAIGTEIHTKRLELTLNSDPDQARIYDLGKFDLTNDDSNNDLQDAQTYIIRDLQVIESACDSRCFVVSDSLGGIRLVSIKISEKSPSPGSDLSSTGQSALETTFTQFKVRGLGADSKDFEIRASSVNLFACIKKKNLESLCRTIKIWSARPDSSCRVLKSENAIRDEYIDQDYWETEIEVESSDCESTVVDCRFFQTGFLDSFPALVAFLQSEAIVYQRRGESLRWQAIMRISYPPVPGSSLTPSIISERTTFVGDTPCDAYPHLLPAVRASLHSYDETNYLLSDWHPESLIAHVCTDERGAKVALKRHVEGVLTWLADLIDGSSMETSPSTTFPLSVAPFDAVGGEYLLKNGNDDVKDSEYQSAANLLKSLSHRTDEIRSSKDRQKLQKLITAIGNPINFEKNVETSGKSTEFKLAMSSPDEGSENPLPPILSSLRTMELRVLWALSEVTMSLPDFKKLDPQGQLTLTIYAIHEALKRSPKIKAGAESTKHRGKSLMSSFLVRRQSSDLDNQKAKLPPQNASAGCVAALLSDCQGQLLDCVRKPGVKLDWSTARELRIPFWVRSDDKLRELSEEIGQNLYRESRDILKSALFFILAGKKRTLRNLAAADPTESGKKFFKFLTDFDFASDRGRSAAEKNAFSLLRKNCYESAAAFFLLADPPALKSAVEIVATKMEDLDLAFMVARLVENQQASSTQSVGLGFGGGSMGGFGSLGGGGGYAGSGVADVSNLTEDQEKFRDWKPKLGKGARDLLLDRGLPGSSDDTCISAIQLLWLGRRDEASHWLSGFLECPDGILPSFASDVRVPRLRQVTGTAMKTQDPTIYMTNSLINFVAGPFLLKKMKACSRTRIASTLLVSNSLIRSGIELPALRSLVQNFDPSKLEEDSDKVIVPQKNVNASEASEHALSIFDGYNSAPTPKQKKYTNGSEVHQATSSIFDSFDAAPQNQTHQSQTTGMASSIFDSFDAPPPQRPEDDSKSVTASSGGKMSSSIFDSFDAAPPPKPKVDTASSGAMTSSIFDSFDAAPPKQTAEMTSSIFDSFDAAPPSKPKVDTTPGGVMASSIFDSFDPAPQKQSSSTAHPEHLAVPGATKSRSQNAADAQSEREPEEPVRRPPLIWLEWREHIVVNLAARRLLRELAVLCTRFHGDVFEPVMNPFGKQNCPLIPSNASHVLQFHCDGDELMHDVNGCVEKICRAFKLDVRLVVDQALRILDSPYQYHRVCFAVLLNLALKQADLAEDIVRNTSQVIIERCNALAFSNDDVAYSRQSISHVSTLYSRRSAAHLSWQLELCLWIHRGGALPLSGIALNEAICAVRIGLLVSSWNRDFECLETMIRQPPDCLLDDEAGRQMWTSLKIISSSVVDEKKTSGASSGGWEFLVDCGRVEATELLRPRQTGCFIIRPHPEDHGVFTLSFKTNLVPTVESDDTLDKTAKKERAVKRDDVVQHAIIRLSDSGFRCGSFGPFATLMKLLEAVSSSLPFDLRFDLPPTEGVIKEEAKPSPNSAFFRKLGLCQAERAAPRLPLDGMVAGTSTNENKLGVDTDAESVCSEDEEEKEKANLERRKKFGCFLELLVLSEVRKQLGCVAAAKYESVAWGSFDDGDSVGSMSMATNKMGPEQTFAIAARILRPLLTWCRMLEVGTVSDLAPHLKEVSIRATSLPVALDASENAIEISTTEASTGVDGGDAVVRRMIQPGSGVEFRTLRLGDGGESAMVVLFSKKEAVAWFINNSVEKSEEDALKRLKMMERSRVIEPIDLKLLARKTYKKSNQAEEDEDSDSNGEWRIRYRLVDPWEVEPLESREAETRSAALGRHQFLAFSLGRVASSCEGVFRSIGGLHLLELWATARGGVSLTKAIATVHPPWERAAGGDLQLQDGSAAEPVTYVNSIRQHLYRNALFRRLHLPQRFLALVQVELLDLKNLTSPGGSLSLTVYSLLRLKRSRHGAPLTVKARTLDSVATHPMKLGKATGPNAPASWGSLVRFRFPLPEHTAADGRSYDGDREALFKGPPSALQVSVYEKKFMSDTFLGGADVKLDGLSSGGQLEEWVPLKTETHGINWFARIRLTLRFELMCLSSENETIDDFSELAPSVGLRRIQQLSSLGGAHEDIKKSASTPDLLSYFESMVS